jgi:hypothetical protein
MVQILISLITLQKKEQVLTGKHPKALIWEQTLA